MKNNSSLARETLVDDLTNFAFRIIQQIDFSRDNDNDYDYDVSSPGERHRTKTNEIQGRKGESWGSHSLKPSSFSPPVETSFPARSSFSDDNYSPRSDDCDSDESLSSFRFNWLQLRKQQLFSGLRTLLQQSENRELVDSNQEDPGQDNDETGTDSRRDGKIDKEMEELVQHQKKELQMQNKRAKLKENFQEIDNRVNLVVKQFSNSFPSFFQCRRAEAFRTHGREQDDFFASFTREVCEYENLILSGGAFNGMAVLGSLHFFESCNVLAKLKRFCGVSVGFIISILLSIGLSPLYCASFMSVEEPINFDNIFAIFQKKRLIDFQKIAHQFFSAVLETSGVDLAKHTMKSLFDLTGKELHGVAFENTLNFELVVVNHETFPHLSVFDALRMVCSAPVVFDKVVIDGRWYLDAGLLVNFPLQALWKLGFAQKNTLAIGLKYRQKTNKETTTTTATTALFPSPSSSTASFRHGRNEKMNDSTSIIDDDNNNNNNKNKNAVSSTAIDSVAFDGSVSSSDSKENWCFPQEIDGNFIVPNSDPMHQTPPIEGDEEEEEEEEDRKVQEDSPQSDYSFMDMIFGIYSMASNFMETMNMKQVEKLKLRVSQQSGKKKIPQWTIIQIKLDPFKHHMIRSFLYDSEEKTENFIYGFSETCRTMINGHGEN